MKISKIHKLLKEYNKSGQKLTTLAAPGGDKASGKNYDRILAGDAQPYKTQNKDTIYMKKFPALARLVKSVKEDEMGGEKMIIDPLALKNLQDLEKISKFKLAKDDDISEGETVYVLPFGDGVRLKEMNGRFFIYSAKKKKESVSSTSPKKSFDKKNITKDTDIIGKTIEDVGF